MEKVILLTGGNGMVGSQFPFGIKPTRSELDITDKKSIEKTFDAYSPTVVIHLAALTNMKYCEEHTKEAEKINVDGTRNIVKACAERNIKLVYISTCAVFDGTKTIPYIETDTTGAVSVYGKTKQLGESLVLAASPNNLIIRTGWLFGGGINDKKFIKIFIDALKQNKTITAIANRYGNPTYIPDLIQAINELLQKDTSGIAHLVNSGTVSYAEAAAVIKRFIPESISKIISIEITPSKEAVPRGAMEGLATTTPLRSWEEAIKEYLTIL